MQGSLAEKKPLSARGRWQPVLIIALPFLLLALAWGMYFTGLGLPEGRTNRGTLLTPVVNLQQLSPTGNGQQLATDQLDGKWLVVLFGSASCEEAPCQDMLYQTRQAHIALGREAARVVRLYIARGQPALAPALIGQHPGVSWLAGGALPPALSQWPSGSYFIGDPQGNLMMAYQPGQSGGDLLRDLQKLLKTSKKSG